MLLQRIILNWRLAEQTNNFLHLFESDFNISKLYFLANLFLKAVKIITLTVKCLCGLRNYPASEV